MSAARDLRSYFILIFKAMAIRIASELLEATKFEAETQTPGVRTFDIEFEKLESSTGQDKDDWKFPKQRQNHDVRA